MPSSVKKCSLVSGESVSCGAYPRMIRTAQCCSSILVAMMLLWVELVTSKTDLNVCFLTAITNPLCPLFVVLSFTSYVGKSFLITLSDGSFVSHSVTTLGERLFNICDKLSFLFLRPLMLE